MAPLTGTSPGAVDALLIDDREIVQMRAGAEIKCSAGRCCVRTNAPSRTVANLPITISGGRWWPCGESRAPGDSGSSASRVFRSCGWCLLCCEFLFYPSAIAHSAFRDQPRRRRPRPNENCPLRMRWANSMPAIVMAAFANDLNPAIDAPRRLIARWSCSMMLFKYLQVRTLT
jgi:hypothetical protein